MMRQPERRKLCTPTQWLSRVEVLAESMPLAAPGFVRSSYRRQRLFALLRRPSTKIDISRQQSPQFPISTSESLSRLTGQQRG